MCFLNQAALERFVYGASAKWGFLVVNGHVLTADEHWWALRADERILLAVVSGIGGGGGGGAAAAAASGSTEMKVFLPHASPSVPFRLVSVELASGVRACMLCGAEPSMQAIEDQLVKPVWSAVRDASPFSRQPPFFTSNKHLHALSMYCIPRQCTVSFHKRHTRSYPCVI